MRKNRMLLIGLVWMAAPSEAEITTLIDDLNDVSHIAFSSGNVGIDTTHTAFFGGDPSRLKRWISTPESLIYTANGNPRSFSLQAWFTAAEAGADFIFSVSADNITFAPLTPTKTDLSGASSWLHVGYTLSALPAGTRYLKVGFPDSETSWTPQIGRVVLVSDRNDLTLPSLFASNMVLQRGKKISIWGKSLAPDSISISFRGKRVHTFSDQGKWSAEIGPLSPGGPDSMVIVGAASGAQTLRNVLVGDVWLCSGQSNMGWPLKDDRDAVTEVPASTHSKIRLFSQVNSVGKSPQYDVARGTWSPCDPKAARGFSAVAYYFAKSLVKARDVPIGLVQAAVGDTHIESWMSAPALQSDPAFAYVQDPAVTSNWHTPILNFPSGSFHAMLHPLMPLGLTGVVWYQGENNISDPSAYRQLLPALIRDWRNGFKQHDLPFLVVQLPAFGLDPNWPAMREAQAWAMTAVPKVGMTVNVDLGESANIHPTQKQPFGERLALMALGMVYGEAIEYASPQFTHSALSADSIWIEFDHVGTGLKTTDGMPPTGFELAGSDSVFYPAHAVIQGPDRIRIRHPLVENPLFFRYAWRDVPHVNLVNGVDLPAGPFRSNLSAIPSAMTNSGKGAPVPALEIRHTPTSLHFRIHSPAGREAWAVGSLFDLQGVLLRKGALRIPISGEANMHMDMKLIRSGVYVASLATDRERIVKRIWIR